MVSAIDRQQDPREGYSSCRILLGIQGLSDPHRVSLDLVEWCPCAQVCPRTSSENQEPKSHTHNCEFSPQNYSLKCWPYSMAAISHIHFSLYTYIFWASTSLVLQKLVQVMNNLHVAKFNGPFSVDIVLLESIAFITVIYFLLINSLSSIGFQDTRLSGFLCFGLFFFQNS